MAETLHKHSIASDAITGAERGAWKTSNKGFLAGALGASLWTLPAAAIAAGVTALAVAAFAPVSLPLIGAGFAGMGIGTSAALVAAGTVTGLAATVGGTAGWVVGGVAGAAGGTVAGMGNASAHNKTVDMVQQGMAQQQQMNAGIQMQRQELMARGQQAAAIVQTAQQQQAHRHHHTMSNPALQAAAPQNVVAHEIEHAGRVNGIERAASMA